MFDETKMSFKGKWHSLQDPPKENGYVLLAIEHHDIPMVVMAHYKEGVGFKEEVYSGHGVQKNFWTEIPENPLGEDWRR
jgi:hypothetical protein